MLVLRRALRRGGRFVVGVLMRRLRAATVVRTGGSSVLIASSVGRVSARIGVGAARAVSTAVIAGRVGDSAQAR